jgi:hypothetical protein
VLDDADAAIQAGPLPRRIRQWLSGTTRDAAWESVHRAEAQLVEVTSREELYYTLPRLRSWMRSVLPDRRALADYEHEFARAYEDERLPSRAFVRRALEDVIAANGDRQRAQRHLRNLMLGIVAALAAVLLVLGIWHAEHPSVLSLCTTIDGRRSCFGGGTGASPTWSVLLIELFGMLGGLVSAAFLLWRMRRAPSRYNLLVPQLLLKAVIGAAMALGGVVLLQSGLIVSPAAGDVTAVLLAYALVFGFSQELVTRFVDRRVAEIVGGPPQHTRVARDE